MLTMLNIEEQINFIMLSKTNIRTALLEQVKSLSAFINTEQIHKKFTNQESQKQLCVLYSWTGF